MTRKAPRRRITGWNETSDAALAFKNHGPMDRAQMSKRAGMSDKNATRCVIKLWGAGLLTTQDYKTFDLTVDGHALAGNYIKDPSEEQFAEWNKAFSEAAEQYRNRNQPGREGSAQPGLFQ